MVTKPEKPKKPKGFRAFDALARKLVKVPNRHARPGRDPQAGAPDTRRPEDGKEHDAADREEVLHHAAAVLLSLAEAWSTRPWTLGRSSGFSRASNFSITERRIGRCLRSDTVRAGGSLRVPRQ